MTFVIIGDEFSDEARDLSHTASRLHVEDLKWSARRLLDLEISNRDVPRLTDLTAEEQDSAMGRGGAQ